MVAGQCEPRRSRMAHPKGGQAKQPVKHDPETQAPPRLGQNQPFEGGEQVGGEVPL